MTKLIGWLAFTAYCIYGLNVIIDRGDGVKLLIFGCILLASTILGYIDNLKQQIERAKK
jgi:hypothetical protein